MSMAAYTLLLLGPAFSTVTSTGLGCAEAVNALPAARLVSHACEACARRNIGVQIEASHTCLS